VITKSVSSAVFVVLCGACHARLGLPMLMQKQVACRNRSPLGRRRSSSRISSVQCVSNAEDRFVRTAKADPGLLLLCAMPASNLSVRDLGDDGQPGHPRRLRNDHNRARMSQSQDAVLLSRRAARAGLAHRCFPAIRHYIACCGKIADFRRLRATSAVSWHKLCKVANGRRAERSAPRGNISTGCRKNQPSHQTFAGVST
jgi:hypothetical protein